MKTNIFAGMALAGLVGLGGCATSEDIVPVPYTVSAATATPGEELMGDPAFVAALTR